MPHHHYVALVEFHSSGDQTMIEALKEKLVSLADTKDEKDNVQLLNILPIYEKV